MATPSPLFVHSERVRRAWIDYNGHMHEAYYALVFANATDSLYDHVGMGAVYRESRKVSIYTLESHITFLRGVGVRVPLRLTTQFLDLDDKRIHLIHAMYNGETLDLLATSELMLLHIDATGPRAAPFPPDAMVRLEGVMDEHARLPRPEQAGHTIAIRRGNK